MDDLQKRTGLNIPIHVDGASGAFVAPFAYPNLKWSFEVPRVVSINTSGHKFGLVYPGLGWVLWRDESYLHKELIFELRMNFLSYHIHHSLLTSFGICLLVDYLGSTEYTFTLLVYSFLYRYLERDFKWHVFTRNFSKPAAPVFAQMFNFLNLGFEGYKKIAYKDLRNARLLSRALEKTYFTVRINYSVFSVQTVCFIQSSSKHLLENRFLAMYIVQSKLLN